MTAATPDAQILADVRELLYQQGLSSASIAELMSRLVAGVDRIELAPVFEFPSTPAPVIAGVDGEAIAAAIAHVVGPAIEQIGLGIASLQAGVTALANRPASAPVTMRGGGLSAEVLQKAVTDGLGASALSSRFTRLLKFEPSAGEEIRRDETPTDDYHGAAPDGSNTANPVWDVVRFYKTATLITRVRFRTGIVWDNRSSGW